MISVILPIYNVEPYIDKCLTSILTNTYQDLEVICVNDGSTDGCFKILQSYKESDPRIVIIDQENRGLCEARNSGLKVASGEYIAFIDPDDWVHPQYFESLLNCMEETNADIVICNCQKVFVNETHNVSFIQDTISYRKLDIQEFNKSYYLKRMVWARLYRYSDTNKINFPPEVSHAQDALYNLRIIASYKQPDIYMIDEALYYYLQRPDSLIRSRSYETMIQSADWYVENGRDPHHVHTGDWGSLLLIFVIRATLSCRYQASLWKNSKLLLHTNALLHTLHEDLIRDKCISFKDKLVLGTMIRFPEIYRQFRIIDDPTMKNFERHIMDELR